MSHPNHNSNDDGGEDSRKLWPFFFIIPIKSKNGISPHTGRRHPDMLNGAWSGYLSYGKSFAGFNNYKWIYLPTLTQVSCSIFCTAIFQSSHTTFARFTS